MSKTKLSKKQFLNRYPDLVAKELTQEQISNRLGLSRTQLWRLRKKWGGDIDDETNDNDKLESPSDETDMKQEIEEVKRSQEEIALENGEASAQKSIQIAFDRIVNTINTLDEWREDLESKSWKDPYFIGRDEGGEPMLTFHSKFDKDEYVLRQVREATQEAKSLLNVAKTIFKKDEIVRSLEVNIDNRHQELKYGLDWNGIRELLRYIFTDMEADTVTAIEKAGDWMRNVKEIEDIKVE